VRPRARAAIGFLTVIVAGCRKDAAPALANIAHAGDSRAASVAVLSSTPVPDSQAVARTEFADQSAVTADSAPSSNDADLAVLRRELAIPVSGVLSGELRDTFTEARSEGRVHDAIDIPAPRGTPVLSAAPGRVLKLFTSKLGGLMVYAADSTQRFILLYGHLDGYAPNLFDGAPLTRGQTIGFVGTTGNAPPNLPHLHFAVERSTDISKWWQGTAVNPYPLLKTK
jgi:peptidoglycan LD-endopeptidase LytH